ncbi:MBL fold metallo-hydrolase [Cereibacter sp. SYSU M97828]|nr:MBL fold metallo-hydrolase [Cereibacter flavus]
MFISEIEPPRGEPLRITDRILRLVAPNPGPMTYHGTNTYIVGTTVIDPGPADDAHIDAIIAAAGGRVDRILLTHAHEDHVAGVAPLVERTGAMVAAGAVCPNGRYALETLLFDGDVVDGLTVVETPGHSRDHLCFVLGDVAFTGDHVLGWAPTSVLAPEGCAARYHDSLARLADLRCRTFLPGHGPQVRGTRRFLDALMVQMAERERSLWTLIADRPAATPELVERSYSNLGPQTRSIAERTVEAVLLRLEQLGRVVREDDKWRSLQ